MSLDLGTTYLKSEIKRISTHNTNVSATHKICRLDIKLRTVKSSEWGRVWIRLLGTLTQGLNEKDKAITIENQAMFFHI